MKKRGAKYFFKKAYKYRTFLVMLLPAVIYTLIFSYYPMTGIVMAFKKYNYADGIWGSPWSGLGNFKFFFQSGQAGLVTRNTVLYNVDGSQEETRRTAAVSSGDYPDIMAVSGAELIQYARNGVIADITQVYEQYATEELQQYESLGEVDYMNSARVDGKLYGIPKVSDSRCEAMMMFIRQDWLDNLNLEIPTTMEELKKVAYAFTWEDPDGNGKNDTYGLALNGKEGFTFWSGIQAFFEGYGAAPGYWNGQFTFIEREGRVMWGGALADEMKAALTDLQEMYRSGSLTQDFGMMDYNQIIKETGEGRCGIYFAPRWGAMVPAREALLNDSNAHFVSAKIPDGMGEGSSRPYNPTTDRTVAPGFAVKTAVSRFCGAAAVVPQTW